MARPAVGMNAFYYAKCLQLLNRTKDSIDAMYDCIAYDKYAVSPWLELFECYLSSNELKELKKISAYVLSSPILYEQLESDELDKLRKYK